MKLNCEDLTSQEPAGWPACPSCSPPVFRGLWHHHQWKARQNRSWLDRVLFSKLIVFPGRKLRGDLALTFFPVAGLHSSWEPARGSHRPKPKSHSTHSLALCGQATEPSKPLSPLFHEANYTSLTGSLWGLNEVMLIKCVAESLVHGTPSRNTNPRLSEL